MILPGSLERGLQNMWGKETARWGFLVRVFFKGVGLRNVPLIRITEVSLAPTVAHPSNMHPLKTKHSNEGVPFSHSANGKEAGGRGLGESLHSWKKNRSGEKRRGARGSVRGCSSSCRKVLRRTTFLLVSIGIQCE